jgi:hypothetical protein
MPSRADTDPIYGIEILPLRDPAVRVTAVLKSIPEDTRVRDNWGED